MSSGEHPGASSGQHHQPSNRVLQQFAPGHSGKISRQSTAQQVPHCCTRSAPADPAASGAARNQTEASASRCAGNQTTDGSTVAPPVKGATAGAAQRRFAARTRCQGTQGRQPGRWPPSGGFHRDKDQVEGAAIAIGSVCTGPGTTISPSSVRSTSAEWAVRRRPSAPSPQTGRRQSWCRWRRDQLAQP